MLAPGIQGESGRMQLRTYQTQACNDIRSAMARVRRVLFVMATGGGKTATVTYIAKGVAANRKRVLILAHRRELLHQISQALNKWGVRHAIIDAQRIGIPRADVVVGSVFTVFKRLRHMPKYHLVILDEAHHASDNTFGKTLAHFKEAYHLGITATAARHSGEPLSLNFDEIVLGPQTAELTAAGFLCPAEVYAPTKPDLRGVGKRAGDYVIAQLADVMDRPALTGDSIKHYRRLAMGKRAIVFACSIKHAESIAAAFNADGIPAAHVEGKMPTFERDRVLKRFADGEIKILCSVSLVSEGFDCPQAEVGIMLRPTESTPLYIQMIGRLLRPFPGKSRAIILDHANLTARHGWVDQPRNWTLAGELKPESEKVPRVMTCAKCFACYPPARACPRCGAVPEVKGRKVEQVDGELGLVTDGAEYDAPATTGDSLKDATRQYWTLRAIARQRGYDNPEGWAFRIISARLAAKQSSVSVSDLAAATIDRDTVTRAMSREDPVAV